MLFLARRTVCLAATLFCYPVSTAKSGFPDFSLLSLNFDFDLSHYLWAELGRVFVNLDALLALHTEMAAAMAADPSAVSYTILNARERMLAYAT